VARLHSTVSKKRHFVKAITWRIVATIITMITTFVVTGSWKIGFSVGLADTIIKFGAYYFHERLWYKNKWGVETPEETI